MALSYMYVWVPCACGAWEGQKRGMDALELESQLITSIYLVGKKQIQVLDRRTKLF